MLTKKLVLGILLILTITVFTVPRSIHSTVSSPDGLKFCKKFVGNVESVTGEVTIKDAKTGQIYWKGELPEDNVICIEVVHNTELIIQWKDWRGAQEERYIVECNNELINEIPFPKFD